MRFNVQFNQVSHELPLKFESNSEFFGVDFAAVQVVHDYTDVYDGAYDVVPEVTAQTLPTKEKLMLDNLRVKAIPYYDVSNMSGGSTVYIGMEV